MSALRGYEVPCGSSGGCEMVASSILADVFGIPLAAFGFFAFLGLAGLTLLEFSSHETYARYAQSSGYALSGLCALVCFGLTCYSVLSLGTTCAWCLGCFACFAVCLAAHAGLSGWGRFDNGSHSRRRLQLIALSAFLLALAAAITTHLWLLRRAPSHNGPIVQKESLASFWPTYSPVIGVKEPRIILVFFGDLQCRACKQGLPPLISAVRKAKDACLVYRHFPRDHHALALPAAIASERSKQTVGFWTFVEKLYRNRAPLSETYLRKVMRSCSVDSVNKAAQERALGQIESDLRFGKKLGLDTTPTVIVIDGDGRHVMSAQDALSSLKSG